ncbi:MAG: LysR family transcriptional regulator [Erysipelotrichaceae bacterium]|nr:LysR family transcriptional regulator [Erysipelotrichaceae bacterium]
MYNKSLDVFKAVAECSSFTKASQQLYISHTAVIKQINQLENYLGVKLFKRTHQGVILTSAGHQLYNETLQIMEFSTQAIKRVQDAYFASPQTLRIGSSLLYPCHDFMHIWDKVSVQCPQYKLNIVPFQDDEKRLTHLYSDFDLVIGPYNNNYQDEGLLFFLIDYYHFCIAMPRSHPLTLLNVITFDDLKDETLMIMKTGTSPINDQIRLEILNNYPRTHIIDIDPHYNLDTFNNTVQQNCLLLSLDCWSNVHPALVSIPLEPTYDMPYGIILPKESQDKLQVFITALQNILK